MALEQSTVILILAVAIAQAILMVGQFLGAVGFLVLLLPPTVFLGATSQTLGDSPLWVVRTIISSPPT